MHAGMQPGKMLTFTPRPPKLTGWKPRTAASRSESKSKLHCLVSTCRRLDEVQDALQAFAGGLDPWEARANDSSWEGMDLTDREKEWLALRTTLATMDASSDQAIQTRRRMWRLRLAMRFERKRERLHKVGIRKTGKALPRALQSGSGLRQEDQSKWGELMSEHFAVKFRRDGWSEEWEERGSAALGVLCGGGQAGGIQAGRADLL